MTEVNHNPKSIHFVNNLLAKNTYSAMRSRATSTITDVVIAVMAKRYVSNSTTSKVLYVRNIILNSQSILYTEHDTLATLRLV